MDINAITTPSVGSKRPIAALDLPLETTQDATIDLNAPVEPTLEPPTKRAKVDKLANPNILKTKIYYMKGLILTIFCWDKPFSRYNTTNEDYKILVYDMGNKKVYESTHVRDKIDPEYTSGIYRLEIGMVDIMKTELELILVSASNTSLPLSGSKYNNYKAYVAKDGYTCLRSECNLAKSQYNCKLQYRVCGQWTLSKTNTIKLKNTNDYALHIIAKYKKASDAHKETQKVFDFKL
ncbi:hypothetical protein F-VV10_0215 [Faustovirus]|nr:hypothetical protein F-VV10_0215 [Faustovirus]